MTLLTLPPFTPHPGQRRLIAGAAKRNVACCGRRWGKTYALTEILLNRPGGALAGRDGLGRRGLPCAWYAPNDAYFTNVFQGIAHQYAPVIRRATSQPRPVIEFRNGGSVDFWTLENPMKCGRGNHYARVIVDEAAHARHLKEAWEMTIEFTLADLDGDAWFISTPYGMNYFAELFRLADSRDDWASLTAPSTDNPHLTPGWMEEKRRTMPERVYHQEVLAQFLEDGGGVFRRVTAAVDTALATDPGSRDVGDGRAYVIGVDWGRHQDFTVFVVLDARDKAVVALDRFTQIEYSLQLARLRALRTRYPHAALVAEANSIGGPLVEQLRRDGVNVSAFQTTHASKGQIIESLAVAFEQGELRIPATQWLIDELLAFDQERTASGLMRYSAPAGSHDDGVMALAIAWHAQSSSPGHVASAGARSSWGLR